MKQITQSTVYMSFERWLDTLPSRDRLALKVLSIFVLLLFLFFGLWQPAAQYMQSQKDLLETRVDLLKQVKSNSAILASLNRASGSGASPQLDSQQLVSTVTNMAQQQGVALKRFEPSGEQEIKIWVDDVAFDKLVAWLASLKKRIGVEVDQISVEKEDKPGLVSARMTLRS